MSAKITLTACVAAACLLAVTTSRSYAAPPTFATEQYEGESEKQLLQAIANASSKADKAIACKKLAFVGTADSVATLAELLRDPELVSWARIALEAIPDPAVDEALIAALAELHGRSLIGVIQSLAAKQTPDAVGPLTGLMLSGDADVAGAAAISLGAIGGDQAAEALATAVKESTVASVRSAAAEGLIVCAEQLHDQGAADKAAEFYDMIRTADL